MAIDWDHEKQVLNDALHNGGVIPKIDLYRFLALFQQCEEITKTSGGRFFSHIPHGIAPDTLRSVGLLGPNDPTPLGVQDSFGRWHPAKPEAQAPGARKIDAMPNGEHADWCAIRMFRILDQRNLGRRRKKWRASDSVSGGLIARIHLVSLVNAAK